VSTTDPDARVMKMPDGWLSARGFNVQLATTTDAARAIVGVSVTNRGSDQGQATPMLEQIEARTGVRPPSCSSMVAIPVTTPSIWPPPRA
jgi:hypothetical protein